MRQLSALFVLAALGCNGDDPAPECGTTSDRVLVTADWLNRSLTLLDAGALTDSMCDFDDVFIDTIDLSEHAPGPIEVEMTPQGEAVVAVGPGFLGGTTVNADRIEDGGAVLVVDLETRSVRHVIETPDVPMGIAITPDGRFAYTANYGEVDVQGTTLSLIDLDSGEVVTSADVGALPEQVVLDSTGEAGVVNSAGDSHVVGFLLNGDTIELTPTLDVGADPSDVTYLSDERAVATSSLGISYSVIDTSDRAAPVVLESFPTGSGIPYGVTTIEGTTEVLVTTFLTEGELLHVDLAGDQNEVLATIPIAGSPLSLVAVHDPASGFAFLPQPNDSLLTIVDLATQSTRSITWLTDVGPTYAALYSPSD